METRLKNSNEIGKKNNYLCKAEFGIWGKNLKFVGAAELSNIQE